MTLGPNEDWDAEPAADARPSSGGPLPPDRKPAPSTTRWVVTAAGIVALLLGIWFVSSRLPGWITQPQPGSAGANGSEAAAAGDVRTIQATMFYLDSSGTRLAPAGRDVPYGATTTEQALRLVEAQVAAPPAGFVSPIPEGTTVRHVFLSDRNEAYVDLGGGIVQNHPGGSLNEALTVYAIVNALTTNLPEIDAVQLLIEGREVDTLRGHIDLRAPLQRGTDWIQKGTSAP